MPIVSIIICAYNAEEFLKDAVNSVLNQTFHDFEIIIVNDGSHDSTYAIARSFADADSRVKVISIENGGLANARNVGMAKASGEFIAFCDADDTVDEAALQTMVAAAKRDGSDMVICGYHHDTVKSDDRVSTVDFFEPEAVYKTKTELLNGIVGLKSKFILDASWNKLFKRSVIVDNNLKMPVGELFEDTAFVLSFLNISCKVSVLSQCFYHYVQKNNGSITKKYDSRKLRDLKQRYLQLVEFTNDADENVKNYVSLYHLRNVYSTLANSYDDANLSTKERNDLIKQETNNDAFKLCAENANGGGLSNKATVLVAKVNWLWLNKLYCRFIRFLKVKAATVFVKIK